MLAANYIYLLIKCFNLVYLYHSLSTCDISTHIDTFSLFIPAQDLHCFLFVMWLLDQGVSQGIMYACTSYIFYSSIILTSFTRSLVSTFLAKKQETKVAKFTHSYYDIVIIP